MGPTQWTLLVQTGFNDIDRRCDGYLQWLEEVRLRGSLVNAQLNDTGRLTNQVLTALYPAAGVTIGIVGEAFGFARSAFNNYQNRLLLGFEGSTIKTIVSERRLDFRIAYAKILFRYKPDAVNALRSYLRICMPYTITMDANTFARTISAGMSLPASFNPELQADTVVGDKALKTSGSTAGPGRPIPDDPNVAMLFGAGSQRTKDSVRFVQQRLCVTPSGTTGELTRLSIANWRRALQLSVVAGDDRLPLTPDEARSILQMATCDAARFTNFYETTVLADPVQVAAFVSTYNKIAPGGATLDAGPAVTSNPADGFRVKIAKMRAFLAEQGKLSETIPAGTDSYVTFLLHDAMIKAARQQ
jgi:hypothetical protein